MGKRTYTYTGETELVLPDLTGVLDADGKPAVPGGVVKPGAQITLDDDVPFSHPLFTHRGKPAVADGATFDANAEDAEEVRLAGNAAEDTDGEPPAAPTTDAPAAEKE